MNRNLLALTLAGLLAAVGAHAQLKPPGTTGGLGLSPPVGPADDEDDADTAPAPAQAPAAASPAAPGAKAPAARSSAAKAPAAKASQAQPGAEGSQISADDERLVAGRLAAAGWLTLLDRRDWGTAWETSAAMFRKNVPLDRWMDGIPKVRGGLGALEDRQPVAVSIKSDLPGQPRGEYVSVVFRSKFAQKTVEEVVTTAHEPDGRWRVMGYTAQ